jgi:hypothetical protein
MSWCEPFAYPALATGFVDETMAPQQGQRGRNTLKAQVFGYGNNFDTPDIDASHNTDRLSTVAAFVKLPCDIVLHSTLLPAFTSTPFGGMAECSTFEHSMIGIGRIQEGKRK